jgi:4-phytase/acid phosphatase
VLERWRDAKSGERYLRVYFQAQGLDDLRRLQTPDAQHPMLRQEWRQPGCRQTDVGTLCPSRRPSPRWVSVSTGPPPRR